MTVTIVALGGTYTSAYCINDAGQVVGDTSFSGNSSNQAFLWQNGVMTKLGALPGDNYSSAWGINDSGQVAGVSGSSAMSNYQGTLWQKGAMVALGALGGSYSVPQPKCINNVGQIVGYFDAGGGASHAFIWQNGVMTDLGTLPGAKSGSAVFSSAQGINDSGQVVGYSPTSAGLTHAVLWQNGTIRDLGTLAGGTTSYAEGINDAGQVVGDSNGSAAIDGHAFLWQNGTMTDLGTLVGGNGSAAEAINNAGQVVGDANTKSGATDAVLWQNGSITDLNSLLPANSGWVLQNAVAINNNGQILGSGTDKGVSTYFVLDLPLNPNSVSAILSAYKAGGLHSAASVEDSASSVQTNLDSLETLAGTGKLASINLTDSGVPTLTITPTQLTNDAQVLAAIISDFTLTETASAANVTITGFAGHANTVAFSGVASAYTITPSGDGTSFTVSTTGCTDYQSNISALQFSDCTDIVASATPPAGALVSTAMVTELYGAVFGRTPDVAGLAYYQAYATAHPSTPFLQFAEWFLASPEYTGNSAHAYPQTSAGDAQFISDCYSNLLHRAPETGAVSWYQSNVINPILTGLTAGTALYTTAEAQAHAQVLDYFSQSPEFLTDVTVTAANPSSASHWLLLI